MTVDATTPNINPDDPQLVKLKLELDYLRSQNEKLSFEVNDLRSESTLSRRFRQLLPLATGLIAVLGFWFGIIQYVRAEQARHLQQVNADSIRSGEQKEANQLFMRELKRETAKPLWDKQLHLYMEATELAATIATTQDEKNCATSESRFWVLYWGPLASVEDVGLVKQSTAKIEGAMVRFGELLETPYAKRDREKMKRASLELAHAVRSAIEPAFDVQATELANSRLKPRPGK